jgi:hypothetical protein
MEGPEILLRLSAAPFLGFALAVGSCLPEPLGLVAGLIGLFAPCRVREDR